jgi:hypothetical protein
MLHLKKYNGGISHTVGSLSEQHWFQLLQASEPNAPEPSSKRQFQTHVKHPGQACCKS